jgi:hypothetical protein
MWEILIFLGLLLLAGGCVYIAATNPQMRKYLFMARARGAGFQVDAATAERLAAEPETPEPLPTDLATGPARKKLPLLQARQSITLLGDRERSVIAAITLQEMEQRSKGAPWTPKGGQSVGIVLSGDIWLMRVPDYEGGPPRWFKFAPVRNAMGIQSFYLGGETPETWGPARRFVKQKHTQGDPVPYRFISSAMPTNIINETWQVVDVGAFTAQLDGDTGNVVCDGDFLGFVSSTEKDGERRLIFLDPRKMAGFTTRGRGGLYVGEPFDPDVDVTDIL